MNRHKSNLLGILLLIVFIFNSCFKDDLLKEIDALKTQVSSMQKRNDSLNNVLNVRADSLGKALSNAQKRSDSLSNVLRTKSDSLSQALGLTNANLANLSKSVDSIKIQIATISGQLTQLNLQLTSITTQLTQLNQQLGALGGDVSQLAAQYQTLSASLQTINTQIAALQAEQLKLLEKLNAILLQLNPPIDLTTGLVAYYPFSGNAGDSSGNGKHGTVNGATLTTDRFGIPNKAYSFNGNGNYIGNSANNLPQSRRTISVWFFANSLNGGPAIMGYGGNNCGTSFFIAINQPPIPNKIINQGHCIVDSLTSTYSPNLIGSWNHLVITTDESGTRHYLNGIITSTNKTFISNTYTLNKDFAIGSNVGNNGIMPWTDGNQTWWNGKLDDIRIYNRALTQQEITYLATH